MPASKFGQAVKDNWRIVLKTKFISNRSEIWVQKEHFRLNELKTGRGSHL